MPSYLSPGVYVEEVPAGSRPIEGVGTAVAAFGITIVSTPFTTAGRHVATTGNTDTEATTRVSAMSG